MTYTAAANPCVTSQSGTIIVTSQPNQTFTVTENGSPNNLTLSPASLNAPQAGTSGHLNVITGDPCAWSAFSRRGIHSHQYDGDWHGKRRPRVHDRCQSRSAAKRKHSRGRPALCGSAGGRDDSHSAIDDVKQCRQLCVRRGSCRARLLRYLEAILGHRQPPVCNSLPRANNRSPLRWAARRFFSTGTPAPLTYASATQINAIAPVGLAGKASTQVQVSYQGSLSNTITIPVAAAAPGIFAADASGVGGGAILNQDSSVNGRLNPAARGSVVAIYLTGAGATNPPGVDGAVTGNTPPFPSVAQAVTVTIGGVPVPAAAGGLQRRGAGIGGRADADRCVRSARRDAGAGGSGNCHYRRHSQPAGNHSFRELRSCA